MTLFHFSLWLNNCVYIPHFIYPFIECWALGLFCSLAIMNNVVINMGVQVSLSYHDLHSFGYMPKNGRAGLKVVLFLVF
jgi:hypothetical protein